MGQPADMWSLGCVLAEVALQRPLFPAHTPAGLLRQVLRVPAKIAANTTEMMCTMVFSAQPVASWYA